MYVGRDGSNWKVGFADVTDIKLPPSCFKVTDVAYEVTLDADAALKFGEQSAWLSYAQLTHFPGSGGIQALRQYLSTKADSLIKRLLYAKTGSCTGGRAPTKMKSNDDYTHIDPSTLNDVLYRFFERPEVDDEHPLSGEYSTAFGAINSSISANILAGDHHKKQHHYYVKEFLCSEAADEVVLAVEMSLSQPLYVYSCQALMN